MQFICNSFNSCTTSESIHDIRIYTINTQKYIMTPSLSLLQKKCFK